VLIPGHAMSENRQIPGNGERMSGAVERYRDVSKWPQAPRRFFRYSVPISGLQAAVAWVAEPEPPLARDGGADRNCN